MTAASPLTTEHLVDVKRELGPFPRWHELGLNLGLHPDSLDVIKHDYRQTDDRLEAVLLQWLKGNCDLDKDGLPSWRRLAEAVEPIDPALSLHIKERDPSSFQSELFKAKREVLIKLANDLQHTTSMEIYTLFTRTILNRLLIGSQESDLNRFTINRFLAAFTRTRLNRFYVSCEGGVLGGVLTLDRAIMETEKFCDSLTHDFDEEIDVQESRE